MQTRKKIFETNSSSTHSAVVLGTSEYVDINEEGDKIEIFEGFFHDEYLEEEGGETDWKENAQILHAWARRCGNQGHMDMLKKVIEDFTKKEVVLKEGDEWEEDLEISEDDVLDVEWAFKDEQTLKNALFLKVVSRCKYGYNG